MARYTLDDGQGGQSLAWLHVNAPEAIEPGVFTHIAVTRVTRDDGGVVEDELILWADGKPVARAALPDGAAIIDTDGPCRLASDDEAGPSFAEAEPFTGRLDEVRFSAVARYGKAPHYTTPDKTDHANHGTSSGDALPTVIEDGRFGPAMTFDGVDDVVTIPDDAALELSDDFTLDAWVRRPEGTLTGTLLAKGDLATGDGAYRLDLEAGKVRLTLSTDGTTPALTITAADILPAGVWTRVTALRSTGLVVLYQDTAVQGSGVLADALHDGDGALRLGAGLAGDLDHVRVIPAVETHLAPTLSHTVYEYNARNQLTSENTDIEPTYKVYGYDVNGNNTTVEHVSKADGQTVKTITMAYDDFNRMTRWSDGTDTEEHEYAGFAYHRSRVTVNGGDGRTFVYDGADVLGEYDDAGALKRRYVTPFLDENLSLTEAGGATYYYSHDGLGSVRTITDAFGSLTSRKDYHAFGALYTPATQSGLSTPSAFGYTGREISALADQGAPMQYRYRAYNPDTARFSRRDPAGYPSNWHGNLYTYVSNRPFMLVDPFGLDEKGKPKKKQASAWWRLAGSFVRVAGSTAGGAVAGAVGGAVGGAIYGGIAGLVTAGPGGFLAGVATGATGGAIAGAISGAVAGAIKGIEREANPNIKPDLGDSVKAGLGAGLGAGFVAGSMAGPAAFLAKAKIPIQLGWKAIITGLSGFSSQTLVSFFWEGKSFKDSVKQGGVAGLWGLGGFAQGNVRNGGQELTLGLLYNVTLPLMLKDIELFREVMADEGAPAQPKCDCTALPSSLDALGLIHRRAEQAPPVPPYRYEMISISNGEAAIWVGIEIGPNETSPFNPQAFAKHGRTLIRYYECEKEMAREHIESVKDDWVEYHISRGVEAVQVNEWRVE